MQFTIDMAQAILDGKKTETRRPRRPGDHIHKTDDGGWVVKAHGRCKWRTGQTYAIQPGRGKPQIARLKLIDIDIDTVDTIGDAAAKAEGFANRDGFIAKWRELYPSGDYAWENNPYVWILKFETA